MTILMLAILLVLPGASPASDEPFTSPSNWGGTGLMETPTARVMPEGRIRVGAGQADPYRYFFGTIGLFKGLEVGGRVTEILDVPALTSNYGNYRDKAVDLKYQFVSEGMYLPAIALGIMDVQGTRLYASQYLVASKQIYPLDFSIGLGNGRFGRKPLPAEGNGLRLEMVQNPADWLSQSQFFGGIQFALTDHWLLMAEYNPIRYQDQTTDPAQPKYFRDPVPSRFNFGLRWKPFTWTEFALSWQRGNQLAFSFSAALDLGISMIPIYDRPYSEDPKFRSDPVARRITRALHDSGFGSIGVEVDGSALKMQAQNNRYFFHMRAVGAALRALAPIVPAEIDSISLQLTQNGIPVFEYATSRADLLAWQQRELTTDEYYSLSVVRTDVTRPLASRTEYRDSWDYGLKPALRTYLNDPSGFFKYRVGAEGWLGLHPWRGASLIAGAESFPLNNVSSSNQPSQNPVRSDIVLYQDENVSLSRLLYDQVRKFNHEIYGRATAGLLEIQYAGLDAEVAKPLFGGRLFAGLSGSAVRKRDPEHPFRFKENDYKDLYTTAFFNTRLNIPEFEMTVELNTGQFLAGDRGTRITVSRFFNDVKLSAWYGITNTSLFRDSFNKGYHDSGVSITVPLRFFKGSDSRTAYTMGITPWTRDVAQDIDHYNPLFDFIGRSVPVYQDKDRRMLQ